MRRSETWIFPGKLTSPVHLPQALLAISVLNISSAHARNGRSERTGLVRPYADTPPEDLEVAVRPALVHRESAGRTDTACLDNLGGFPGVLSVVRLSQAIRQAFVQCDLGPFQIAAQISFLVRYDGASLILR